MGEEPYQPMWFHAVFVSDPQHVPSAGTKKKLMKQEGLRNCGQFHGVIPALSSKMKKTMPTQSGPKTIQ
jgi:hypothetical protein